MLHVYFNQREFLYFFFFWNTKEIELWKKYYSVHFYCFGKDLFVIWCIQYWWNSDYGLFCCKHEYFHFVKVWCATDGTVSEIAHCRSARNILHLCLNHFWFIFFGLFSYITRKIPLNTCDEFFVCFWKGVKGTLWYWVWPQSVWE